LQVYSVYVLYPAVTHRLVYTSKEKHGATDASSSPLSTPQDVVAIEFISLQTEFL
jgi:hypothetical protein